MQQSPSWNTNRFSASQEINFSHFTEPEDSLPHSQQPATCPYSEPDQSSPCPPPLFHFLKIQFNIIPSSRPGSSKRTLSLSFPTKTLYGDLLSLILAACPVHSMLFDLNIWIIFGKQYRSLSSSLCSLLHSPVTSSLLGPRILLNTIF